MIFDIMYLSIKNHILAVHGYFAFQTLMNVLNVLAMLMAFVTTVQEDTLVLVKKVMMEMVKSGVMVCIIFLQNSLSSLVSANLGRFYKKW